MPNVFVQASQKGRDFFGAVNGGPPFFVGRRVTYQGSCGLMNSGAKGPRYSADDHRARHGFWADFLLPTATCESGCRFACLNTYDRAAFTFGFLQYAAHVPDGDFVEFFRRLLALPGAAAYFPELRLHDGRIVKDADAQALPLETAQSTQGLMDYLNPAGPDVDPVEVVQAAKLIHWCVNDPAARDAQVDCAVDHMRRAMAGYARRYGLDGVPDQVCVVVADIRHQGRARHADILAALNCGGDYEKARGRLLELGRELYPERVKTLRATLSAMVASGVLGAKKYDARRGEFV